MSHLHLSRGSVLPILLVGLAVPSAAVAAPSSAPFNLNAGGNPTSVNGIVGVAADGGEVVYSNPPATGGGPAKTVSRNLRTNTTSPVLPTGDYPRNASSNLNLVLFLTTSGLSPNDTNGGEDLYIANRTAHTYTLVSRGASGVATGDVPADGVAFISGDGSTVYFDDRNAGAPRVERFDVATETLTTLPAQSLARNQNLDTAGRAVVTNTGIWAAGKSYYVPSNTDLQHDHRVFRISSDGFTVADQRTSDFGLSFGVTDLRTGVRHQTGAVIGGDGQLVNLIGVSNGGTSITVLGATPTSDHSTEAVVEHISTATGAVTQLGQPIPNASNLLAVSPAFVLSPNESFVASGATVTALGTVPVPGGTPATPATPLAVNHLVAYAGCLSASAFQPAIKPSFVLTAASSVDGGTATGATVTFYDLNTGAALSTIPVKPGVRVSVGTPGVPFRYLAHVSFSDGSDGTRLTTLAGTTAKNDTNLFTGRGTCRTANGL